MIEVIVALAIIAVLTAVLLPAINGKLRDARTASLTQTFLGLSQGIAEFKRATTKYPGSLTFLTTQPTASSTDKDICGNSFSATTAGLWRGPYSSRIIPSTGITMGDAIIQTTPSKVLSGTSAALFILIDAYGVESSTVDDLESSLDGSPASSGGGTIRWTNGSSTSVKNVQYAIPTNSC